MMEVFFFGHIGLDFLILSRRDKNNVSRKRNLQKKEREGKFVTHLV
jgi:hypothetical protein